MSTEINEPRSEEEMRKLLDSLNLLPEEKDTLYRILWEPYVAEDVNSQFSQLYIDDASDDYPDTIIDDVVYAYVWENRYDCNLSYWDNINNLIADPNGAL